MKHNNSTNKMAKYSEQLESILAKRIGGAVNITGIYYQMLYACFAILKNLQDSKAFVRLEGIEDIDVVNYIITREFEYIQLKSSKNSLDANTFWNLGVLQNYLEVYHKEPRSRFTLIYNMKIASGNLKDLFKANMTEKSKQYWLKKLNSLPYNNIDYLQFLETISFKFASIDDLTSQIIKLLYEQWNINYGTEIQFLKALFYNVLIWSRDRKTINRDNIIILFQEITDSYSKAPKNEAIKNDWIKSVLFADNNKDCSSYYEGKAALPIHIVQELPVRRTYWEKEIKLLLNESDVTIIKSSSGQGKSTLAWQTCYNMKAIYSIYQVNYCPDLNSANSILEFIHSRLSIGQSLLIVFDGLNSSIEKWNYIVENSANLPVKFIITARNEDWYRYSSDISKANIRSIDIKLSKEEAHLIYDQLQIKGKLKTTDSWQSVWEKVQASGLLIEYTYLLTKGEMIQERLKYQLSVLNKTLDAAAKLEILRLVSLADSMGIKIQTQSLLKYIIENIGFTQDRGEILKELSHEYFLDFENIYIEGLHPVRSNHLISILYQNLTVKNSLISLFKILDEIYFPDYFMNAPLFIEPQNSYCFFNELGEILSHREFHQMVTALDGVFHLEAQVYWSKNKLIYDKASKTNSIELFTMISTPFENGVKYFHELENNHSIIGQAFNELCESSKQLTQLSIRETNVYQLASCIQKHLEKKEYEIKSYLGFGSLAKWFITLNLHLNFNQNILFNIDVQHFFENIDLYELNEAKEIATFLLLTKKKEYFKYSKKHQKTLISYLKKATDSVVITEGSKQIHINYLLYDDIANANNLSVQRIETIHAFLPNYKYYCTEAIMIPFPCEEIISSIITNSKKRMSPENIVNKFDIHLNQIWYKTILKKYQSTSVYEWQKQIIELRENAVNLMFSLCQFIDSLLEANDKKRQSSLEKVIKYSEYVQTLDLDIKPYPFIDEKYYEEIKKDYLNNWRASLRNVNNQLQNIFLSQNEHSKRVALYNLKAVYLSIADMQNHFNFIVVSSFEYFDISSLQQKELEIYERIYITIQYYMQQIPLNEKPAIKGAKNIIKAWWKTQISIELSHIKTIFHNIHNNYIIYLPSRFEDTDTSLYATIGVEGLNFSDEDAFLKFIINLTELADLLPDAYTILNIKNGFALEGLRFNKDFFKVLKNELNGQHSEEIIDIKPYPVIPDKKMVQSLNGVSLLPKFSKKTPLDTKLKVLIELWKLKEYRDHLNKKNRIETKWLTEIQEKIIYDIKGYLRNSNDDNFIHWVNQSINNSKKITTNIIIEKMQFTIQNVKY